VPTPVRWMPFYGSIGGSGLAAIVGVLMLIVAGVRFTKKNQQSDGVIFIVIGAVALLGSLSLQTGVEGLMAATAVLTGICFLLTSALTYVLLAQSRVISLKVPLALSAATTGAAFCSISALASAQLAVEGSFATSVWMLIAGSAWNAAAVLALTVIVTGLWSAYVNRQQLRVRLRAAFTAAPQPEEITRLDDRRKSDDTG